MGNVMRKRYDGKANPADRVEYPVASADPIEIGDLVWLDINSDTVKAASHADVWEASEAATQLKFAERFVGVANSAHAANDAAVTHVGVFQSGTFGYPCTSSTFQVGDRVRGKKAAGNTLLAQEVERTTTNTHAIGKVQEHHSVATAHINFQIRGRGLPGGGNTPFLAS